MTKVSVITPSYNQGSFIEKTILSVLHQTVAVDEYIILDSLSTDNTSTILTKYQNQAIIMQEKDNGQTDALNKGFRKAQHEIIGWLNSDDVYALDAIETAKKAFENDPSLDVVYGDALFIDGNDNIIGKYPTLAATQKNLFTDCVICQPAVFFKKELLKRFGYLNENQKFGMDYEFWLRLMTGGAKFHYIPQVMAYQRIHADAKTIASSAAANKESCELLLKYSHTIPLYRIILYAAAQNSQYKANTLSYLNHIIKSIRALIKQYQLHYSVVDIINSVVYCFKKLSLKHKKK